MANENVPSGEGQQGGEGKRDVERSSEGKRDVCKRMVIASPAAAAKARVRRTVVQQPIFAASAVPKRKRKVPRRKEADGKARVAREKNNRTRM